MNITTEERLARLEKQVQEINECLLPRTADAPREAKHGWRWFVGIFADSPDFDEVERVGREWREADRPADVGGICA